MSSVCTRRPSGPVCLVTSTLPSIFSAKETASSTDDGDLHAALKSAFEHAFAASAGVDLRFDDDFRAAAGGDFLRRRADFGE